MEEATFTLRPQVKRIKEALLAQEPALCLMSGSGSTVFGLFEEERAARKALREMRKCGCSLFLARPLCRPSRIQFD